MQRKPVALEAYEEEALHVDVHKTPKIKSEREWKLHMRRLKKSDLNEKTANPFKIPLTPA